ATRFEGSSLVTLEAMAHALPVVATRAGGIPDKVVEGETGALAEPGDAAGLAAALAPLLGDAERRAAWGGGGRAPCCGRPWPSWPWTCCWCWSRPAARCSRRWARRRPGPRPWAGASC